MSVTPSLLLRGSVALSFSALSLLLSVSAMAQERAAGQDWPMFGGDVQSTGIYAGDAGITASGLKSLHHRQIQIDGTVDASLIYLKGVNAKGAAHDLFFLTTTYGKTIALDANSGNVVWEFTPADYSSYQGSYRITNSTPVADPDRQYIYAAAPDGKVRKLAIADGRQVWSTAITLLPQREKIASALKIFRGHVIAVTAGYVGDEPPYQGHVAIIDAQSAKLLHVWNSLCSNRTGLIQPKSCEGQLSAIWGSSGATIDPDSGNIFVATGNGPYNGRTDWSDSVIELNGDATEMLGNFTPSDYKDLEDRDLDVGSSSPALLGADALAQSGKDGKIHILSIHGMAGTMPHVDHELETLATPNDGMLYSTPVVWRHDGETWLFVADFKGDAAYTFANGRLTEKWNNSTAGNTPVIAGGLLYIYNPAGSLHVYDPANGKEIVSVPCGRGHWNSPIVVDGKIAAPVGNANSHKTRGVLELWTK